MGSVLLAGTELTLLRFLLSLPAHGKTSRYFPPRCSLALPPKLLSQRILPHSPEADSPLGDSAQEKEESQLKKQFPCKHLTPAFSEKETA